MDRLVSSFRNIFSQPTTDRLSNSTTEEKVAVLVNDLNIDHCSTSTLLGALKLTGSRIENKDTEPATSGFAKRLSQTTLSPVEMQLLQKSLITHLPDCLQEQAKVIITTDDQNAAQAGNKLSAWVAVNHVVAKLLENIPDIKKKPFLALEALSYAWGYPPSKELQKINFPNHLERAKNDNFSNLTFGTEEFATARNNFNDAVREQLLMFSPSIKKQYHHINSSNISYDEKRSKISLLLDLHLALNEAIEKISSPSQKNPLLVECRAILALCNDNLFDSSADHELETKSLAALKEKYVNSRDNAENPERAEDIFEDSLMRALAMGLFDCERKSCLDILDGTKSMKEMKVEIKNIVFPYYGFACRMSERF